VAIMTLVLVSVIAGWIPIAIAAVVGAILMVLTGCLTMEEAYRSLLTALADVESRDRSTTISGEWLRTEQVNFDLDLGDTEDLVKAVRADLEARARYLEAVKRYNVAVLNLLEATGTLADRAQSGTLLETEK